MKSAGFGNGLNPPIGTRVIDSTPAQRKASPAFIWIAPYSLQEQAGRSLATILAPAQKLSDRQELANTDSLDGAHDAAAVLDWRIDPTRHLPVGPLPWLPGIPAALTHDPAWGPYLSARADQLTQLAAVAQVATQQAQAGRGFVLGETAFERQCWN